MRMNIEDIELRWFCAGVVEFGGNVHIFCLLKGLGTKCGITLRYAKYSNLSVPAVTS